MKGKELKFFEILRKNCLHYQKAKELIATKETISIRADIMELFHAYEKDGIRLQEQCRKAYDDTHYEEAARKICRFERELLNTCKEIITLEALLGNSDSSSQQEDLEKISTSAIDELINIIEYTRDPDSNALKTEARYRKLQMYIERAEILQFEGLARLCRDTIPAYRVVFTKSLFDAEVHLLYTVMRIATNIRRITIQI